MPPVSSSYDPNELVSDYTFSRPGIIYMKKSESINTKQDYITSGERY
jgi:hypothetical protein